MMHGVISLPATATLIGMLPVAELDGETVYVPVHPFRCHVAPVPVPGMPFSVTVDDDTNEVIL